MSVYLYDKAIVSHLQSVFGDTRISIGSFEDLYRKIADQDEDTVQFPIVRLTRLSYELKETGRSQKSARGSSFSRDEEEEETSYVQILPVEIQYQLDVMARGREQTDNITREVLFMYINNPTLTVDIPYGYNSYHKFNLIFATSIDDNSDIENHDRLGEYFRSTMVLTTSGAYLWKTTVEDKKQLEIELLGVNPDGTEESYGEDITS